MTASTSFLTPSSSEKLHHHYRPKRVQGTPEKLFSQRLHAQNFLTQGILKKVSERYRVQLGPSADGSKLEVKSSDPKIAKATEDALQEVPAMLSEHGLQADRIQNLKMATVPIRIFSSFALRNVINSDFHPSVAGALWIPDMLAPDPYFVLPVAVGVFGFLNLYSQRKIYPGVVKMTWKQKSYDAVLAFFTMFAVSIMSQLPACIPMYWLIVSMSGMAQAQLLRHPKIKSIFGIKKLPTDSRTPIVPQRDNFFQIFFHFIKFSVFKSKAVWALEKFLGLSFIQDSF